MQKLNQLSPASGRSIDDIIVFLVLLFPVMGTFFSPETYFSPQDFSVSGAAIDRSWPIPVTKITNFAVCFWLIFAIVNRLHSTFSNLVNSISLLVFTGYMILSSQWSFDPSASFNRGARAVIIVLFAVYIFSVYGHNKLIKMMVTAYIFSIVLSFIAMIVIPQYGYSLLNGYLDAWRGAFSHKNTLGSQMSLAIIFLFYAYISKLYDRRILALFIFLSFVLIILSKSMTSLLCTIACVIFMSVFAFIVSARDYKERVGMMFFICIAAFISSIGVIYADDIFSLIGRSSTLTGRTDVWLVVNSLIDQAPPWGVGNGFWSIDSALRAHAWKLMGWAAPHAHSTYLDIWFQLGIIGLCMAGYILFVCVGRVLLQVILTHDPEIVLWSGIVISVTIRGSVETGFVEPGTGALFPFALAFLGVAHMTAKRMAMVQIRQKPGRRLAPNPIGKPN